MEYIDSLQKLIAEFTKLPSVGRKTAQRFAYSVLNMSDEDVRRFADALIDAKKNIGFCSLCGNYTDKEICSICSERDRSVICVVAFPRDINAIEKSKQFKGVYHVLKGTISPLDGIGPDNLRIKELLSRLDGVKEIIVATNPDVSGEATALYISKLVKPLGIKVTRLAHGIPIGGDIEYTDEVTLARALDDRKEI